MVGVNLSHRGDDRAGFRQNLFTVGSKSVTCKVYDIKINIEKNTTQELDP